MTFAIGDIHGCLRQLKRLVSKLPPEEPLVFLGDYVDRGPDSSGVISYLIGLGQNRPCHFLRGNHEALMMDAETDGTLRDTWLRNGGDETLRDYGLSPAQWTRHGWGERLPAEHRAFLRRLLPYHEDQEAIYVHAGIDTDIPRMEDQDPQVLMWIRGSFIQKAHLWRGKSIVFGHTPNHTLQLAPGEIIRHGAASGIDTGCVYGGCLSALNPHTMALVQVPGWGG